MTIEEAPQRADAEPMPVFGEPPPNLANLDAYYEIGLELDLESVNERDDAAYRALHEEKLAERALRAPLTRDHRLRRR